MPPPAHPANRLIHETSPYLLQHAHNPVDWYPWGDEAFAAAREQDKPILLSVGYATCYWCHVMEREVFENAELAALMNEHCISIKVDREQRPDVDDLYMTATQLLTGRGGWPMNVFLTPPATDGSAGLRPFWAGTYIPPQPMHGMPGFAQLIEGIAAAWRDDRDNVLDQAGKVADAVAAHLTHRDTGGELSREHVERAAGQLLGTYDREHAGFGGAPKFPHPANLQFLQALLRHDHTDQLAAALAHTLDRMARGGVYDQVAGGFHRYSVGAEWLVPHFEKMLYDNAQLVEVYTDAWAREPRGEQAGLYARIVRETCDYVLREMLDDTGAFYSAQDAEVDGREGGNYLWTRGEVERVFVDDPSQRELAVRMYGLDRGTNFRDPHHPHAEPVNVLYLPEPLDALARERGVPLDELLTQRRQINARLKAVRDTRPQPATDDKVLTSWNGLMIAALARAGRLLDEPRYIGAAARAASAVLDHLAADDGSLHRAMRQRQVSVPAFLEDYAALAHGLIELHRAQPGNDRWLAAARTCTQAAIDRFAVAGEQGGYYDTLPDQADLLVRLRSTYDGVIPSANSQMVHNLLDLHELTHDDAYLDRALRDLQSVGKALAEQGIVHVHMQHALLRALEIAPDRVEHPTTPTTPATDQPSFAPVAAAVDPDVIDLGIGVADVDIHIRIEPGFHLNSHEPRDATLTPTAVELVGINGALAIDVDYPAPVEHQPAFADAPLPIYQGEITLRAHLRRTDPTRPLPADAHPRLILHCQPCTDTACHQPRTIELPLSIRTA
ncbi:MAG: DUF255 domain-containing protein [Phycisphaeraceae bacterium]